MRAETEVGVIALCSQRRVQQGVVKRCLEKLPVDGRSGSAASPGVGRKGITAPGVWDLGWMRLLPSFSNKKRLDENLGGGSHKRGILMVCAQAWG